MELNRGQQEYILELLSYEYLIPEDYYPSVKNAIARYAATNYDEDELQFLLQSPQSIAATLMLNTTNSLQVFANYYALWLNCLEYNMFDSNSLVEAVIINPDPTSLEKLLQVINTGDDYQVIALPQLRFNTQPRATTGMPVHHSERRIQPTPTVSAWSYRTAENLMLDFLNFANQSDLITQSPEQLLSTQEYVNQLQSCLKRSLSKQLTWPQLREKCLSFSQIDSAYVFADRREGLIMPSNIQFINYLNAQPVKRPVKQHKPARTNVPVNPFTPQINFFNKLKNNFHPERINQNLKSVHPPKFSFPFNAHKHTVIKKVSDQETGIPSELATKNEVQKNLQQQKTQTQHPQSHTMTQQHKHNPNHVKRNMPLPGSSFRKKFNNKTTNQSSMPKQPNTIPKNTPKTSTTPKNTNQGSNNGPHSSKPFNGFPGPKPMPHMIQCPSPTIDHELLSQTPNHLNYKPMN